ncbi:hypothetical protein ACFLTZ_01235 [Chloroflexota bacterium]
MGRLEKVQAVIKIPQIGEVSGTWVFDEKERNAAWEMYVELVTRISTVELKPGEGLLKEALTSLYSVFNITRSILRKYGPSIAKPKGKGKLSFGYLAIAILNNVLRPLLAKWHPLLSDYENQRPDKVSVFEHEKQWEQNEELRREIEAVRIILVDYANLLAKVANVPTLI